MYRYRYRPVTIPLPLQRSRDSPLPNFTNRYQWLLTVTESYRYFRYKRHIKTLNICSKCPLLRSVTLVTQVTVKFGYGQ